MKTSKPRALSAPMTMLLSGLGLLAVSPAALAQAAPQILSVEFVNFMPAAPLSDWLTAGVALLLAASAVVVLRRQTGRAGRLFGWMLAVVAGTTLFAASGQRIFSEAVAIMLPPAQISLTTSPGTLNASTYAPNSPLNVPVTNNSGQTARITAITLSGMILMGGGAGSVGTKALIGMYEIAPSSTCGVGTVLSNGNSCTITLVMATFT